MLLQTALLSELASACLHQADFWELVEGGGPKERRPLMGLATLKAITPLSLGWGFFLRFFGSMGYLVCFYERFGPCTTTVRSWSALQDVSPSGCWTLPGLPSVIDYGHKFLPTGIAKCWYRPSFICGYKLWGSDQKNEFVDTSCENELPVEAGFLLRAEVRSSVIWDGLKQPRLLHTEKSQSKWFRYKCRMFPWWGVPGMCCQEEALV